MEVPDYTLVDFLNDMAPFNLSYRVPRTIYNLLVFWSQEGDVHLDPVTEVLTNNYNWDNVQDYLKSVLCKADTSRENVVLIQFWAPTSSSTIGGRRSVFTTSNQPFGIKRIERVICEYRKRCTSLEFNVFQHEEEGQNDFGAIIRRVFRRRVAESTEAFTSKDILLRDCAHKCGIRRSMFLPLFKPSGRCRSGVLELIYTSERSFFLDDPYILTNYIFKEANFVKPSPFWLQESAEIEEINKALQGVCTTHQLPLAQIWIPCCTSTAMASVDSPGERCHSPYLSCSSKFSSSRSQNAYAYIHFMCQYYNFRKGEGIVGKALLYHKPCFCRDVTQLPKAEYPLSNVARFCGLTGCCAIWVHSTRTKNHDYVLEFFLPPWNTVSGDPQRYLELLLATVKKKLPGFKISSVGEESCIDVCEISVNYDEPDSVGISQTFSVKPVPKSFVNEKETVQNKVVGETVIGNGSNILGLEQNGIDDCHSENTAGEELFVEAAMNDEVTIRLPPMPKSLRSENDVVQQLSHDEPTMEEAVRKNEWNVGIVKQTNAAVISSERIFSRAEELEREYRTTDITLSHKDLRKHFGKKLEDAAKMLEASRSTMKCVCRRHNIKKWPALKRKKVNVLRVCIGNEGTYKGDPLCSDQPPLPTTAGISHQTSNSRQEQDVGTVTVKATHGGDTIRFDLPFLSRKTDLVEKVTTRLRLNEGSFHIKYQDEDNDWILIACDEDLEHCFWYLEGK